MKINRCLSGTVLSALGILLVSAGIPAYSQCNMRQDPTPKLNPGPPGQRLCCALGTHTGIDPGDLTGHQYGHIANLFPQTAGTVLREGEPLGYIYTSGAGLVDLGHVRDNADMVLFVYAQLLDGQHRIYTSGGDVVGVPKIPAVKADLLGLAGAIVFANAWAHELTTWGSDTNVFINSKAEDFSAFSPEDLSSNIVGIYIATRAITAMTADVNTPAPEFVKQFDTEMDLLLPQIIASLGPLSAAETTNLVTKQIALSPNNVAKGDLTGIWYMDDTVSPGNTFVTLLRRNFDGAPWKIPGTPQGPSTPAWLNTTRFTNYYSQFLYIVHDNPSKPAEKADVDATLVPKSNAHALETVLSPVAWVPTPMQNLNPDARQPEESMDPLCLVTPKGEPIPSGQYTPVKVNVYPPPPHDVVWSFEHATSFLQKSFTAVNPNMDGPVTYVAPDIPRPKN